MDAPTEWTYGGLLDWSSADSLKLAPVGMACRCIMEAMKERAEAANYGLPEILTEYNPFQTTYLLAYTIQDYIRRMAISSLFLNHVVYPDFDGQPYPTIDTHWTLDSILSAAGIETRIIPQRLNQLSAEWAFQQYKILNLLRQVPLGFVSNGTRLITAVVGGVKAGGGGLSPEQALSSWSEVSEAAYPHAYSRVSHEDTTYYYSTSRGQTSFGVWNSDARTRVASDHLAPVIDFYTSIIRPFSSWSDPVEFLTWGDPVTEGVLKKINTTNIELSGEYIMSDFFPASMGSPPNKLDEIGYYGWGSSGALSVLKFDGENGFKFRDW